MTKDPENIDHIDLKKEAAGMLYRSSQEHWKVNELIESRVHSIGCLKMRLEHRTGMTIYPEPLTSQKSTPKTPSLQK